MTPEDAMKCSEIFDYIQKYFDAEEIEVRSDEQKIIITIKKCPLKFGHFGHFINRQEN